MEINCTALHTLEIHQFVVSEFEEAIYNATLQYSLRNLTLVKHISEDARFEALQKALEVCCFAGIDSKSHFKQIYVSDLDVHTLHIDWLMSEKGVRLILMQIPLFSLKNSSSITKEKA